MLTRTNTLKMQKKIKLSDLYESQISKHMFKCLNLNANSLPKHSGIHNNYNTSNKNHFISPKYNAKTFEIYK